MMSQLSMTMMALVAIATAAAPTLAASAPVAQPEGLWINPHGNVAVRTGGCGDRLCGWIVWANEEARSDARDGGVPRLLGTELLESYAPHDPGSWTGTVFVPDMGKHFASRIDQVSPDQLRIKGCILGGLICKSQVWSRIERLPSA